ncbi:MAG: hypothetical protein ACYC5O_14725 [Anaerolineae bacterium]
MTDSHQEVQGEHDLIEIRDPEIDVDAIMRRVREGVERKRREGLLPEKQFPRFGVALMPAEPAGEHDVELYYHLQRSNDTCTDIGVDLSLADSPFTTMPVVGRVWSMLRRQVHGLIVYYLGLLSRKQVRVNTHLVSTMNRLVAQSQSQAEEIAALRQQVAQLRQELGHRQ